MKAPPERPTLDGKPVIELLYLYAHASHVMGQERQQVARDLNLMVKAVLDAVFDTSAQS